MSRPRAAAMGTGARGTPPLSVNDQIDEVTRLLEAAAYFPIFNVHNPSIPNQTVPLLPVLGEQLFLAINVNESLHRFEVVTHVGPQGMTASNRMSREPIAEVHIRWTTMPDDFAPGPGLLPPPTILNPFRSQRFTMLNGQLSFNDRKVSGVQAFGSGRTFPVTVNGQPALNIGAVIDVLSGSGDLAGLPNDTFPGATMVINGFIQPPNDLALNLILRVMDPTRQLAARGPVVPLVPSPASPDPGAVFMFFLGEVDPRRPVRPMFGPDGRPIGLQVFENLRQVRVEYDIGTSASLQSRTETGPVVGTVSTMLYFDFQNPGSVIPVQTKGGVFSFHDPQGRSLGSVFANMVEGRAFRTYLPGASRPVFRMGGFGPIRGGTGALAGAAGMLSLNSVVSVTPSTLSNLYVFRFEDPNGGLRTRLQGFC
ncbi:MAG TPA: hypothetical protein VKM72_36065 [Thermoanaerobaculia bacterium]|nr:hypothetical protein [Thermoanaerobaculia bacterium]